MRALIDRRLIETLRAAGYSVSEVEEIMRRLRIEPNLRDEFAKAAMQGLLYDMPGYECAPGVSVPQAIATDAYEYADAMLEARKPKEGASDAHP